MRPARPWSWALLVLLLVALTAAATAADGGSPPSVHDLARHDLRVDGAHPGAVDAVAVLAERLPTSGPDRGAPAATTGLVLLGLALAARRWALPLPPASVRGAPVPPPGGTGRRAPPRSRS